MLKISKIISFVWKTLAINKFYSLDDFWSVWVKFIVWVKGQLVFWNRSKWRWHQKSTKKQILVQWKSTVEVRIFFAGWQTECEINVFLDVMSKFRFNFPATRSEIMQQLEHDEDSDALVQRRKNECIEIGEVNKTWIFKKLCYYGFKWNLKWEKYFRA